MTNESFQHQLKVLLIQIDKHLDAAEKAIQDGKTTQAEADIHQSREHVRQIQDAASRITD